jgi:hypothetical protein
VISTLRRLIRTRPRRPERWHVESPGRPVPLRLGTRHNRFEAELARQAAERQALLLEPDGFPPNPPGFSAEDFTDGGDGFLPLSDAARAQGCTEAELLGLIRRGLIEVDGRGSARPAIVSVLPVRPVNEARS